MQGVLNVNAVEISAQSSLHQEIKLLIACAIKINHVIMVFQIRGAQDIYRGCRLAFVKCCNSIFALQLTGTLLGPISGPRSDRLTHWLTLEGVVWE